MRIPIATWRAFCHLKSPPGPWAFFPAKPSPGFFFAPSGTNAHSKCAMVHILPLRRPPGSRAFFPAGPSLGFSFAPSGDNAHLNCNLVRISPPNATAGTWAFFWRRNRRDSWVGFALFRAFAEAKFGQLSDQCVWIQRLPANRECDERRATTKEEVPRRRRDRRSHTIPAKNQNPRAPETSFRATPKYVFAPLPAPGGTQSPDKLAREGRAIVADGFTRAGQA